MNTSSSFSATNLINHHCTNFLTEHSCFQGQKSFVHIPWPLSQSVLKNCNIPWLQNVINECSIRSFSKELCSWDDFCIFFFRNWSKLLPMCALESRKCSTTKPPLGHPKTVTLKPWWQSQRR